MPIKIQELLNSRNDIKPSQEAYEEQLRIMQSALRKVEHLKNTMPSRDIMMKEFAYINTVLSSPVTISQEDDQMTAIGKLDGARKELATKIEDTEGNIPPLKVEEIKDEANANTELPKEEPKEIEPIVKYPLNEKTLTKYAISTPNLLTAASVVLTEKDKFINKEEEPASIVDGARVLLDDAAKRTEFAQVVRESYNEELPLIDNVVKFFNTNKGNKWLVSKEGKKWINYVMYKHPVALENARIVPEDDFEILTKEEDTFLESQDEVIAMEDTNGASAELAQTLPQGYIDNDNDEETMKELSDNADKISRLEEQATLIQAGIDNIDELQANGSLSVESAITYIKVLDELKSQVAKNMKIDIPTPIEVSTEDLQYDPVGGLSIAREGLVEFMQNVYEFLKKMIIKLINWFKKVLDANLVKCKLHANKAKKLLNKLGNKKALTADKFDTIQIKLLDGNRPLLFVLDYNFNNVKRYMDELLNSSIRIKCQVPLKQIYGTLNKLNSDLGNNQKAALAKDAAEVSKVFSKENIVGNVFGDRSKFISKLDKLVSTKKKEEEIIPIFVSRNGAYGLSVEATTFNSETIYNYDIRSVEFTSLQGNFSGAPRNDEIKSALTRLTTIEADYNKLKNEINILNNYSKSFIESFNKFTKNKFFERNSDNKEVSKVVKVIVGYAKTVCIKYSVLDYTNYLRTSRAVLNMCDTIIEAMD